MRLLIGALCLVVLWAAPAAAQVAHVTSNSAKDVSGTVRTLSVASADCSGANTACYIALAWRHNATSPTQDFTSITHGGSSVTILTAQTCRTATGGCLVTAYICNGGGSGNITATLGSSAADNANMFLGYEKLSGVDCAGAPVGTTVVSDSTGGTATTVTTNVTTTANGMAADGLMIRDEGTTNLPTAGQTQRFTQSDAGSMGLFSSTKPHTATSLGWTWTVEGSLEYVHSVTPFNASGGAATVVRGLLIGVLP